MLSDDLIQIPKRRKMLINLTSLIDVLFVLLLFMMVTTTFSTNTAVKVSLPDVKGESIPEHEKALEIAVTRDEKIVFNGSPVTLDKLPSQITFMTQVMKTGNPPVHFKVDKGVAYGFVLKVMSEIKKTGVQTIMAITETEEGKS